MKQIRIALMALATGVLPMVSLTGLPIATRAASSQPSVPGQVIVGFKPGHGQADISAEMNKYHGQVKHAISQIHAAVVDVSPSDRDSLLGELSHNPNVQYSEPDFLIHAEGLPNDPSYGVQWGLTNTGQVVGGITGVPGADIHNATAWNSYATGTGPKIAILDSGIDESHPDLAGKIAEESNFSDSATVSDQFGHGTHVAGIVAADTNNGTGVAGVCSDCQLMNGKVLGDNGYGSYSSIASGLAWAADNGAKVINMSLGGTASSSALLDAVNYAYNKGAVVVAAAGNSSTTALTYPAAYSNVIAVAATDNRDTKASYSNYGSWVDIAAPGSYIYSTTPTYPVYLSSQGLTQNYGYMSGTSMATPMVAGVAGLVWQSASGTSAASVRNDLQSTADKIPGSGTYWASGRVDAAAAVGLAVTPTPLGDTQPPTEPGYLNTGTVKYNKVYLYWGSSTDNVKVTGYQLERDGAVIGKTTSTNYTDTTMPPGASYTYSVQAYDAAGNLSAARTKVVSVPAAGIFTGHVTDTNGNPLANVKVYVSGNGFTQTVYTDTSGSYTTTPLQVGSYSVNVSLSGYWTQLFTKTLTSPSTTVNIMLKKI